MVKQKQKSKMTGIIYCWYFPALEGLMEHPYYIGMSFHAYPIRRALCHKLGSSKLNKLLAKENLTVEKDGILKILHENIETNKRTYELEKEEIANHNCVWPNGFNFTHGGRENVPIEEVRKKMLEGCNRGIFILQEQYDKQIKREELKKQQRRAKNWWTKK